MHSFQSDYQRTSLSLCFSHSLSLSSTFCYFLLAVTSEYIPSHCSSGSPCIHQILGTLSLSLLEQCILFVVNPPSILSHKLYKKRQVSWTKLFHVLLYCLITRRHRSLVQCFFRSLHPISVVGYNINQIVK